MKTLNQELESLADHLDLIGSMDETELSTHFGTTSLVELLGFVQGCLTEASSKLNTARNTLTKSMKFLGYTASYDG